MRLHRAAFWGMGFLFCCVQSGSAALIAYWDMDAGTVSGKLPANGGAQAGSVSASIVDIGAGFSNTVEADVAGTDLNLSGAEGDPNRAVGFYRIGSVYENGSFRMAGFDFTGQSDVRISFAYDSLSAFTWNSNLHVDYRINDGQWIDFDEGQSWLDGYVIADISLPSDLNNQSDVDIRIRTNNWLSSYGHLDIDNLQVNAVPEFSQVGLGLALAALLAVGSRRRRQVT
ncbi:hypothetical protein [Puniceicoccus vermicola]|uniref:PEP-CTERM sorting domain-containing protein n=1 Tax=Puniceicoccus vermicola TaxID=388746 RepID=A0A7X1AXF0_9BACT|nr:hypothetical protein [Puniceicoccus vermicola]MBC2601524.1 hypothetical protein [Puniceicoccus vermicola]